MGFAPNCQPSVSIQPEIGKDKTEGKYIIKNPDHLDEFEAEWGWKGGEVIKGNFDKL